MMFGDLGKVGSMRCWYLKVWIWFVSLGFGGGGVNCMFEAKCIWRWVPSFTLEYIELVFVWSLSEGLTGFSSGVGSVGS